MFGLTVGRRTDCTVAKSGDVRSPLRLLQGAESLGANSPYGPHPCGAAHRGSSHSASEPWVCLPVQLQNVR